MTQDLRALNTPNYRLCGAPSAAVTEALETRARQIAADKMGLIKDPTGAKLPEDLWWQALPQAQAELAADSPDVTTRLAEAEDRAAKAEARADRGEADYALLIYDYGNLHDDLTEARGEVVELTRKLDEARGVLREVEWVAGPWRNNCVSCLQTEEEGHALGCRLAAVIAPETRKESQG